MSSSFDISGLSDVSSASINIGDVGHNPTAIYRPAIRHNNPARQPVGRAPVVAQETSASSVEISGSDLSGSIEIDHDEISRSLSMGSASRPAIHGKPLAMQVPARRLQQQESASSIEISGSDLSGYIEIEHKDNLHTAAVRGPDLGPTPGIRPSTNSRPSPAPVRPTGPQARVQLRSGGSGYSDSFSISAISSDDLLGELDITDGGGGGREITSEVLSFHGPKTTKTRITRAGLAQETVRESTHTVVISEPESLLSLSSGALGNDGGNLVIEHSEDMGGSRSDKRAQGPARSGQVSPLSRSRPAAVAAQASSGTIEYDEDLLGSGYVGLGGIGSASIEYDASASNGDAQGIVSSAAAGRQQVGRALPTAPRLDASKTPSVSGSSSLSSIGGGSASSGAGTGQRGGRDSVPGLPFRFGQPDSLPRTTGSVRLSRPQSIGGLTAEPVFASGSSRSGVTPSLSSGDGGVVGRRTSSDGGGLGVNIFDASVLEPASGEVGESYDTYASRDVRPSADFSGGGTAMNRSWDRSDRSRGGRRAVDSGGASSSRSSGGSSSLHNSLSQGIDGVRLRGIEELGVSDEVPGVSRRQPAASSTPDLSYSNFNTELGANVSYGDGGDSEAAGKGGPSVAPRLPQPPLEHNGRLRASGDGREFERTRSLGTSERSSRRAISTDSSVADLQHPNSTSHLSGCLTAIGSSGRGTAAAVRYAGGTSTGSSRGGRSSESVISEFLSNVSDHASDVSSSTHKRSSRPAGSRSDSGGGTGSSGSSKKGDTNAGDGHDLLAGLEMVREGSGSSSSSSSSAENIMTVDQLMAHSSLDSDDGGVRPRAFAGGSSAGEDGEYDDYFAAESVGDPPSRSLSQAASLHRGAAAGAADSGPPKLPIRLGSGQREFSFSHQVGAAPNNGNTPRQLPNSILESSYSSGVESPSGASGDSRSRGGKNVRNVRDAAGGPASVPRTPPQVLSRAVPDPRVAVIGNSGSFGSIEEEDDLMVTPVRSTREEDGDEGARWGQRNVQQNDALSSDHSSPSLSREGRRGRRQPADILDFPSGTLDASASHLSQSGTLGVMPVAPGWATTSAGEHREGAQRDGRGGDAAGRGPLEGADLNQVSRDSDLSEEFIPSQAMQRGFHGEQPIFRPLMPNVPTPRASIGALGAVPAFTARGVASSPSEPRVGETSRSPSPSQHAFQDAHCHPTGRRQGSPSPRRVPLEPLSPAVAAAAAPPPPRQSFAATQTDVYTDVVDLDPTPRPGTVKLRTVAMQWGTLNEVSTQVTFDPVSERLVEASSGLHDTEALPPHLRRQLQAHLLQQQQQLYGSFTKRGGGPGLLQAGADALLLGEGAPFSGIGPGFGILSLAFNSVKTAALLEQLERSLNSAASAAGVAPPQAYPPNFVASAGISPYYPYGWGPGQLAPTMPPSMQTPGQAAAAAYAAGASAAATAAAAVAAQPSLPPTPGSALTSPFHPAGASGGDTDTAAAAAGAQRFSGTWPTLKTVTSPGAGGSSSRPMSPLPLTSPSRLRAMSTSAAEISSIRSSAAVLQESSGNVNTTATMAATIRGGTSRRSWLSNSGMIMGAVTGASGLPKPKRSSSSVMGASTSYGYSTASAQRSGSNGSDGSAEYTEDFEDIVGEESGMVGGLVGGGSGDVETVADAEDAAATTAGLDDEVEEVIEEVQEEVVEEESIPEEDGGDSSSRSSGGDSSGRYSEDFETESVRTQSHLQSHSQSRTASFLRRSSLVGASNSRGKLIPPNSFSGRSLLRRGSVVVPTLAPIASSDTASREDEEDGSPPQGSRMLSRVGSVIKSSSGFKRSASLSITMADDPLLPNQMARILPKTFSTNVSGSTSGALTAQASARRLSADGAGRGQATQPHHSAPGSDAHQAGDAAAASTTAAGAQESQQQAQYTMPPSGSYPPFYPYPPLPYNTQYGVMPYATYTQYPVPVGPAPPAPNVASVLQYLPPPVPYVYPPYPIATPAPAPASGPGSVSGYQAAAGRATAGTAAAALGGPAAGVQQRLPSTMAAPGNNQHQHEHQGQHSLHGHGGGHHHVTFADGSAPGDSANTTGGPTPSQQLGVRAPTTASSFGPNVPMAGMTPHPHEHHQQPGQHMQQQSSYAGIPAASSYLGYGGFGLGNSTLFSAQSTLQRFGAALSSGAFPGLDPVTVRTIRADLVKTAAAVSGQVGYKDIVVEAGAAGEYRTQLAHVKARLAAARASIPSVVPSQEKVVLLQTPGGAISPGAAGSAVQQQKLTATQQTPLSSGGSRILAVSATAPGSYRYTTLEDTRQLINATRPYTVVGGN